MESKKPDGESYLPCPEDRDGERAYIGEISEKGKTTATAKKRRTAAPDRKKHLKDLTEITATIKKKETAIRLLNVRAPNKDVYAVERDGLHGRVREVKSTKDRQFQEKRQTDAELKAVNQSVQLKHENIAKLQGKLMYKTPQKVDEVIRSLQMQLERPLKASEQRQIYQEIDCLKKSKETILEFGENKGQLDALKEQQKKLRKARDILPSTRRLTYFNKNALPLYILLHLFSSFPSFWHLLSVCCKSCKDLKDHVKSITSLKQQEDGLKSQLQKLKRKEDAEWDEYRAKAAERDNSRREINELYDRKRDMVLTFQREQAVYSEYIRDVKEKARTRLKEHLLFVRQDQDGKKNREHSQIVTEKKKPFDDEISSCDTLLGYLEKLRPDHLPSSSQDEVTQEDGATASVLPENKLDDKEFMMVKSKSSYYDDANLSGIYSGVRRKTSKREKKRKHISTETNKKIVHHPTVLQRFINLGIHPPITMVEIAQSIIQITEKKEIFERQQEEELRKSNMKRVMSSPTLTSYSFHEAFGLQQKDTIDSDASVNENETHVAIKCDKDLAKTKWKHKSCPMLESIDNDNESNSNQRKTTASVSDNDKTDNISDDFVQSESFEGIDVTDGSKANHRVHFFIPKTDSQSSEGSIRSSSFSFRTGEFNVQTGEPDTQLSEVNSQSIELNTQSGEHDTGPRDLLISTLSKNVQGADNDEKKDGLESDSIELEEKTIESETRTFQKTEIFEEEEEKSKPKLEKNKRFMPHEGALNLVNQDPDVITFKNFIPDVPLQKSGRSKSHDSIYIKTRTLLVKDACKRLSGEFLTFQHTNDEVVRTEV